MEKVLADVSKKWGAFLVIHDQAIASAREISPKPTPRGREQLYQLLERFGQFAQDQAFAMASAAEDPPPPLPRFDERFGNDYAPTETGPTKDRYRQKFIVFEGKRRRGLQHLKMTTDTGQEVRVYFDQLGVARFLIVEVGHLKTFSHDG